jgi:hypothetical protein
LPPDDLLGVEYDLLFPEFEGVEYDLVDLDGAE